MTQKTKTSMLRYQNLNIQKRGFQRLGYLGDLLGALGVRSDGFEETDAIVRSLANRELMIQKTKTNYLRNLNLNIQNREIQRLGYLKELLGARGAR